MAKFQIKKKKKRKNNEKKPENMTSNDLTLINKKSGVT